MPATRVLPATPESVGAVVDVLRRGGVVALPTETVYGLAGRGLDDDAVRAIYAAKGRPADNPVILHVGDAKDAWPLWALDDVEHDRAVRCAAACWPGPLTLVGEASVVVPAVPRAGLPRVAVRVPAHPFARAVARALGEPFAAPSANVSGRPSPTTAADVLATLDGRVALVVDGGACSGGIESSVVDVGGARPRLLRPGALSVLELRRVLPDLDVRPPGLAAHVEASPGLRHRHYAPSVPSFLSHDLGAVWSNEDVGVVVGAAEFAARGPRTGFVAVLADDAAGYARGLYAALYQAERARPRRLAIAAVPDDDAWAAVRDRLLRATS
jgi:L-threonylcarbamoyladenylate synthase